MALQLENGFDLLLENGFELLLENDPGITTPLKRTFIYEEHLDPIKKRGKAILNGYAWAGQIHFRRETPIQTDFDPQVHEPLRLNELEYWLDRLCMIQQELEAHLCSCVNDTRPNWPEELGTPPIGPDLITEEPT